MDRTSYLAWLVSDKLTYINKTYKTIWKAMVWISLNSRKNGGLNHQTYQTCWCPSKGWTLAYHHGRPSWVIQPVTSLWFFFRSSLKAWPSLMKSYDSPIEKMVFFNSYAGWWCNNPLEKWWSSSVGVTIPNIWENKKWSKPPQYMGFLSSIRWEDSNISHLLGGAITILKNMSQWEGWHPIYEMEK